ncbi:MAG: acetylornithine/succinylornithine family transaminase [Candidatus Kapabacteria bacterium]|nr:acetylornithine/succinylornithine family transaminase [Candidatus Kapabacteria bacterium]
MNKVIERENKSIFQTYNRLPIPVDRAEGVRVYDTSGNVYLDFLGGIAVNVLGHSNPKLLKAIEEQAKKYLHLSNFFFQEPQVKLAEMLKEKTGLDKVFFTNSGSETTDGALKLIRKWGSQQKNKKNQVVAFNGGFHGRTYGALSMMSKPLYKEGMGPFLEGISIINFNDINALRDNIDANTAGLVLEFIQGEGGLISASKEFIEEINILKQRFNFLFVADEIQTGVGRTGKFSSYEHYNIKPDIVTIAKGIGGGLPLGALIAKDEVANVWEKGMHGTTFGGNALSCACGIVVIDELNNGLQDHINVISVYLISKLEALKAKHPDKINEVRGMGLMCGLELKQEARPLVDRLLDEKRIITNATSVNVLRLVPPFVITKDDVDEFISGLDDCL